VDLIEDLDVEFTNEVQCEEFFEVLNGWKMW
jgi:hypothetical protein